MIIINKNYRRGNNNYAAGATATINQENDFWIVHVC